MPAPRRDRLPINPSSHLGPSHARQPRSDSAGLAAAVCWAMNEAARRPTPRPVFDQPTVIAASDRTRHVWGATPTRASCSTASTSRRRCCTCCEFSMPAAGGRFGHSRDNPTIFADRRVACCTCLTACCCSATPSTGETQRASAGEAVFFRRDTWHHGRAAGDHGVRVLEFFSPTPATGASSAYGRTQPYLEHTETVDPRLLGSWPMAAGRLDHRLKPVREHDLAWATRGALEFAFFAATEHLTVLRCPPSGRSRFPARAAPGRGVRAPALGKPRNQHARGAAHANCLLPRSG